jgi:glycosyltransferase involved in cell wall biosynthesis
MIRIIYILEFPPPYHYFTEERIESEAFKYWKNSKNQNVGIFAVDWGFQIGYHLTKYFDDIVFEFWRPDYRADEVYTVELGERFIYRAFPAEPTRFFQGSKIKLLPSSKQLIDELIKTHKDHRDIVVMLKPDINPITQAIIRRRSEISGILMGQVLSNISLVARSNPFRLNPRFLNGLIASYRKGKLFNVLDCLRFDNSFYEQLSTFRKKYPKIMLLPGDLIGIDIHIGELDKIELREKYNIPIEKFVILSSSRIEPLKQIDKLIESLSFVDQSKYHCIITGRGSIDYVNQLKYRIKDKKMESNFTFTGHISDRQIDEIFSLSDLFVDLSLNEGGPIAAWRAMALGIPVLSTCTGSAGIFLKKNNFGTYVPKNYSKEWIDEIVNILDGKIIHKPDPQSIRKKFSWENVSMDLHSVIYGVVKSR